LGAAALACSLACRRSVRLARGRGCRELGGRRGPGRTCSAVLPDGTNEEGEALTAPLNFTRDEFAAFGSQRVILYQQDLSPPCAKIRALLLYYGIPFMTIPGRHPTSEYKKIPVLEINGLQINDSHIIMTSLAPVLTGRLPTEEEIAWSEKLTFEFLPAFEVELAGDGNDIAALTEMTQGFRRFIIDLVTPVLGAFIGAVFRSRYPKMKLPSSIYGKEFRQALGDKPFFHGDQPGPIDLSVYGTYCAFIDKIGNCRSAARFLQDSGLESWDSRMREVVPPVNDRMQFAKTRTARFNIFTDPESILFGKEDELVKKSPFTKK